MPCNAGFAAHFNILAMLAARLRGYRCVLHHHYYRYLDQFQWSIKLLTWNLGPNDLQIVLCPDMESRLRDAYGRRLPIAIVPSTIQMLAPTLESKSLQADVALPQITFRMGHISNLQMEKGLDTAVAVLRTLRQRGRDVQLVLAGPMQSKIERTFIEGCAARIWPIHRISRPGVRGRKAAILSRHSCKTLSHKVSRCTTPCNH